MIRGVLLLGLLLAVVLAPMAVPIQMGSVYYVATNGSDSNPGSMSQPWRTFAKAVSVVAPGDTVYIRGGVYSQRLTAYRDGGGASGAFVIYASYPGELAIIDGTGIAIEHGEGLVTLKVVDYVKIAGLRIQHSNGAGIYAAYSNNIVISGNQTYDTVKSGIGYWSIAGGVIDSNDVSLACADHPGYASSEDPITIASSSQIEVLNNTVHDGPTGQNAARAGGEGINVKEASHDIRVHNNEVFNLSDKVGLSVDAWGGDLHDVAIYDNVSHHNRVGLLVSNEVNAGGARSVYVYGNRLYDNSFAGVYVPSYMGNGPIADVVIRDNTITGNGYGFYLSSTRAVNVVIKDNILSGNTTAVYVNPAASGFIFVTAVPTATATRTPAPTATPTPECIPVTFSDGVKVTVCR